MSSVHKWFARVCPVRQHILISFMCFFAMAVSHAMRTVSGISINEMKLAYDIENYIDDDGDISCPRPSNSSSNMLMTPSDSESSWDKTQGVNLHRAFYLSYLVGHISAGMLADYFGGKQIMGYGVLVSALVTCVTPLMIGQWNYPGFLASRVLVGLFQGSLNPACASLLSHWIPASKRCLVSTLVFSAGHLGTGLGYSVAYLARNTHTWSSCFYFFGGLGVIWFPFWQILSYNNPLQNPVIAKKEKQYLIRELRDADMTAGHVTPWQEMAASGPIRALAIGYIGYKYYNTLIIQEIPRYMRDIVRFEMYSSWFWLTAAHLVKFITALAIALLSDNLNTSDKMSRNATRKLFAGLAGFGSSIFLILLTVAGCHKVYSLLSVFLAMAFTAANYSGVVVNTLDLCPNFSGILMGITDGMGGFISLMVPSIVSSIVEDQHLAEWRKVMAVSMGLYSVTTVIFIIFSNADVQEFNELESVSDDYTNQVV